VGGPEPEGKGGGSEPGRVAARSPGWWGPALRTGGWVNWELEAGQAEQAEQAEQAGTGNRNQARLGVEPEGSPALRGGWAARNEEGRRQPARRA
jgi:hypothetical protein